MASGWLCTLIAPDSRRNRARIKPLDSECILAVCTSCLFLAGFCRLLPASRLRVMPPNCAPLWDEFKIRWRIRMTGIDVYCRRPRALSTVAQISGRSVIRSPSERASTCSHYERRKKALADGRRTDGRIPRRNWRVGLTWRHRESFREGMEQSRGRRDVSPAEQTEGLYVRVLFLGKTRGPSCFRILRERRQGDAVGANKSSLHARVLCKTHGSRIAQLGRLRSRTQGRLTHPLRYEPKADRYVECSWEEAFHAIGAELKALDPTR